MNVLPVLLFIFIDKTFKYLILLLYQALYKAFNSLPDTALTLLSLQQRYLKNFFP